MCVALLRDQANCGWWWESMGFLAASESSSMIFVANSQVNMGISRRLSCG